MVLLGVQSNGRGLSDALISALGFGEPSPGEIVGLIKLYKLFSVGKNHKIMEWFDLGGTLKIT